MVPLDSEKIRAFLALPLAEAFGEEVTPAIAQWKLEFPGVRWVNPVQIHVTLHFFGSLEQKALGRINDLIYPLARKCLPFEIFLRGTGAFPSFSRPRVFWIGIEGNVEPLTALQREIVKELSQAGYPAEERAFKPHLTIGRVREIKKQKFPSTLDFPSTKSERMNQIVLFQSHLAPGGPQYEIIETYPFSSS